MTVRHPLEVARSLQRRDGFPQVKRCLLWLRHVLDAEFQTRGSPRAFVRYRDMLSALVPTTSRVAAALGDPQLILSSQADEAIASFMDPALRHHTAESTELERADLFYPWLRQTNEACIRLVADPGDPSAQRDLDVVRAQFDDAAEAFAAPAMTQQRLLEATIAAMREKLAALEARLGTRAADLATAREVTDARGALLVLREKAIRQLLASTSWLITAPVRALKCMTTMRN